MLVEATDDAGAVGLAAVASEPDPRRRDDLQVLTAESVTDQHGRALQPGQDRVAVAAPGDQAGVADLAADLDQGRVGLLGQRQQVFVASHLNHGATAPTAGVASLDAEALVIALGLLGGLHRGRTPPALSAVVVVFLDLPLSTRPVGRADVDRHPIVAGQGGEPWQQVAGLDVHRGRHPVDAPAPGGAAEQAQNPVHCLGQVGLVLALSEGAAELGRVGEGGLKQVRLASPGSLGQLQPVPLDLLPRLVLDLGRDPAVSTRAVWADRPQRALPDLSCEALVAAPVAELVDLAVKHRGPDVGVVTEPDSDVPLDAGEGVRLGRASLSGLTTLANIGTDGATVEAGVPGDGGDGPPSPGQCHDFHVFLL